jgi:hypothetical protein
MSNGGLMKARVVKIQGIPRLEVDGKPLDGAANLDFPGEYAIEKLLQYQGTGINTFLVTNSAKPYMYGWEGDDDYRYDAYEGELHKLLRRQPDARFFLYVGGRPGAPYRWCKAHQDQLVRFGDEIPLSAPSLASEVWRRDSSEALRRLVQHFESTDLAQHIVGYIPIFGTTEWHGVGETDAEVHPRRHPRALGDFSEPMRTGFRAWLQARYGADVGMLRAAWGRREVNFESADVPSLEQRERLRDGPVLPADRAELAGLEDYFRYYNELNASLAELWCRSIKSACAGRKLVGVTHGYAYGWPNENAYPQGSGHAMAQRILASPDIDFLLAPADPASLGAGGVRLSQLALGSARAHGKPVLHLIETRTHHKPPPVNDANDACESCHLLDSDFAVALVSGAHPCWMDYQEPVWGHWFPYDTWGPMAYDSQPIREKLRAELELRPADAGEGAADVAVLASAESCLRRNLEKRYGRLFIEDVRRRVMPHVGVAFEDYLLEDVAEVPSSCRLYIVLDAIGASATALAELRARMEAGATVVWQYAPGYAGESAWSLEKASELIGMQLARDEAPQVMRVRLDPAAAVGGSLKGAALPAEMGDAAVDAPTLPRTVAASEPKPLGPTFYIAGGADAVLGRLGDTDRAGLAIKAVGRGRSVYSAVPVTSVSLLRALARTAGAHVYSDGGDVVLTDRRHLVVICSTDRMHTIHLPAARTVRDAWSGQTVSAGARSFSFQARRGTTRTFVLGEPQRS